MLDVVIAKLRIESEGYGATDVTESVRSLIKELGLVKGSVTLYAVDRDCFVLGIEYEPNLLADLEEFMKGLGCMERKSPCLALLSKPVTALVINGELQLGVFRRIVFVDVSKARGEKEVVLVAEGVFKRG